jgi:hypothetical protein
MVSTRFSNSFDSVGVYQSVRESLSSAFHSPGRLVLVLLLVLVVLVGCL